MVPDLGCRSALGRLLSQRHWAAQRFAQQELDPALPGPDREAAPRARSPAGGRNAARRALPASHETNSQRRFAKTRAAT